MRRATPLLTMIGWAALLILGCAKAEDPSTDCDGGQCLGERPCVEGERQCLGNQPQTCIADGVWGSPRPCEGTCVAGSCQRPCPEDACALGERRCSPVGPQVCEQREDGCGAWSAPAPCPAGEACAMGVCGADCGGTACAPGETRCASSDAVITCEAGGECAAFGAPRDCPAGTVCSQGDCRPPEACEDACPEGRVVCIDPNTAQRCVRTAAGCLEWGAAEPCNLQEICAPNVGCEACQDACEAGVARCSGGGVQRCVERPDGCAIWGAIEACPVDEACTDGRCEAACPPGACTVGAQRCGPNGRLRCEVIGRCPDWVDDPCPGGSACAGDGQCGDCAPGDREAEACGNCGERARTCGADGRWGGWGACGAEGECRPDTERACGNCGRQVCNSRCAWNACEGQGACAPGSQGDCGACGTRSCDAQCRWGACSNGDGTTWRECNDCGWQFCCPGGDWCNCAARFSCGGGQSCVGAGVCQ